MNFIAIWTIIKNYKTVIIGVTMASIIWYCASLYYNYKIDKINNEFNNYKQILEIKKQTQINSILEQNNILKDENINLINKLKIVEDIKYETLQKLEKANNTIKSNVANGNNRLYINARCTEGNNNKSRKNEVPNTSSMDDGKTSKAVIDTRDAELIISITNKADKYKAQLEALQDWILEVNENNK